MKTLLQETVGILLPLVTLVEGSIFQVNMFNNNNKALINKSISISQKINNINIKFFFKELICMNFTWNKIRCKTI